MKTATSPTELFVATDGRAFMLIKSPTYDHNWYYSLDGFEFFALTGGAGSSHTYGDEYEAKLGFTEPRTGLSIEAEQVNDVITYDGVSFVRKDIALTDPEAQDTFKLVGLPFARKAAYLCRYGESEVILYVSQDAHKFTYDSMKLFIGEKGVPLHEVKVRDVTRYRDGGTTFIETDEGTFYAPTPFLEDVSRTWTPKDVDPNIDPDDVIILETLDPKEFDIVETPEGQVIITALVPEVPTPSKPKRTTR